MSRNAELVRAWHRAAELGQVEEMVALTHPEFEMTESSALPGAVHVVGLEALRSYGYGWTKNWSEWEWLEEELVELPPDRVVFVATLRLKGLRSSIWVEHRWAYLFTIRDGLIARDDGFQSKQELFDRLRDSNVELVRSIYADWERGDHGSAAWADPEIEFMVIDGPSPGAYRGVPAMARAWRDFVGGMEDVRTFADEYRALDGERVLVLTRFGGRGQASGLGVETQGAMLFHVGDGKVTRLVRYWDLDRALAELDTSH